MQLPLTGQCISASSQDSISEQWIMQFSSSSQLIVVRLQSCEDDVQLNVEDMHRVMKRMEMIEETDSIVETEVLLKAKY